MKTLDKTEKNENCTCGCTCCCCTPKGKIALLAAALVILLVGLSLGCCCGKKAKVAVVDVVTLVANSSEVKALKAEQEAKAAELSAWLESAQKTVNSEQDQAKKEALLKQYSAEFAAKREDIRVQYNQKLQVLDNNITQIIANEAKKRGYQLVVAKSYTLYGATDITAELANLVK